MKTNLAVILAICYGTSGWCVTPANAFPVIWEFEGVVDTTVLDVNNLLGGGVTFGTPISGQFTFESTTPDSNPSDKASGLYLDSILAISGFIGDIPFASESGTFGSIGIDSDFMNSPWSMIDTISGGGDVNIAGVILGFGISLSDTDSTMLSNDSLPLYPPGFDQLESARFIISSQPLGVNISGSITSVVPEPATLTLLAVGVFACLKRRC